MKLSEAIKQITDQFGKDVLTEERFVNILADMYPNRDNPAMYGIIRTLVKDGYCSDLLVCDKTNFHTFVSKSTLSLNKKNGYDKKLVEDILLSLAIGCGVVSPKDIEGPTRAALAPSTKQTSQKTVKPTSQKKSAQQPSPPPKTKKQQQDERTKGIALLALSFLGLFLGTFLYVLYLTYSWWMLFTLLLIMFVHLLTIIPGISLYDYKNKTYSYIYSGILIFAFLNYFAPLSFSADFIKENFTYYWGYMYLDGTDGVILCFFAVIILAGSVPVFIDKNSFLESINKKEFVITVIVLALIYGLFLYIPEWDKQKAINRIYAEVSKKESISESLKVQRADKPKDLQFKGIGLLSTRSEFNNIIMRDTNFTVKETYDNKNNFFSSELSISYNGINYQDVIESVVCCDVKWDNKKLKSKTFFIDDLVVAISIKDKDYGDYDHMYIGDILPMYTQKYGEPELTFGSGFDTTYYLINNNYYPSYKNNMLKDTSYIDKLIEGYNWTYKNGGIEIKRNQYPNSISISYVSSLLIEKYEKYTEKVKEQEIITKKRKRDSLHHIRIEQEKKREQEKIQRDQEHRKSIEQI